MKWQTKSLVPQTMIETNISVSGLHLGLLFESNPNKIHYIMKELFKMLQTKLIKPTIHEILPFDNVSIKNICIFYPRFKLLMCFCQATLNFILLVNPFLYVEKS